MFLQDLRSLFLVTVRRILALQTWRLAKSLPWRVLIKVAAQTGCLGGAVPAPLVGFLQANACKVRANLGMWGKNAANRKKKLEDVTAITKLCEEIHYIAGKPKVGLPSAEGCFSIRKE